MITATLQLTEADINNPAVLAVKVNRHLEDILKQINEAHIIRAYSSIQEILSNIPALADNTVSGGVSIPA